MLPCTAARIHGPALRLGYTALRCGHDSRGWLLTRLNIKKIGVKLISFSIIENKNVVHFLVEGRGGWGGGRFCCLGKYPIFHHFIHWRILKIPEIPKNLWGFPQNPKQLKILKYEFLKMKSSKWQLFLSAANEGNLKVSLKNVKLSYFNFTIA